MAGIWTRLRHGRTAPNERLLELEAENAALKAELAQLAWPPGHFYSPIPALSEIRQRDARLFGTWPQTLSGIDLAPERQGQAFTELADFYPEQPFSSRKTAVLRYFFDNPNFNQGEAITLYGFIRRAAPTRIVEIGSGYSSCATLDVNDRFFGGRIQCTFVEPYPELLKSLLMEGDEDRINLLAQPVQDVDFKIFEELGPSDILFIDSSHVAKTGSDVNHLYLEVLPRLRAGVLVHIHDIYYPFEYPRDWVYQKRAWNECYLLRAFLAHNDAFAVEYFNSYWAAFHHEELARRMPLCAQSPGSSIWLRKTK
jgi:predicted O-methyltransferase YrrM